MCTFQPFLRNLLREELEKLNIQSFNPSVFLHKAVADLSWEEYFEDLKKSCKSKINSEAFDIFIEVDPAEFAIRQEQCHGDNIRPTVKEKGRTF